MEIQEMPIAHVSEGGASLRLEDQPTGRIAYELWQRGSLPEPAPAIEVEVEEVASHASCL